MDEKVILVTGIGGNVGQGIIRNIRNYDPRFKVIGTNIVSFSSGNHLCNKFYLVPYAYEETYIETILAIVASEKVDLIIPSTDYEVYHLSKSKERFSCAIAVSSFETAAIYFDKYETFRFLNSHRLPFATSYVPSKYDGEHAEIILKPKKGRGSRGIEMNPVSLAHVADDEYMVQELHRGIEITTAFYVDQSQNLHGFITFERSLENGTTTHCKVIDAYDEVLKKMLIDMISVSEFRGSANVQSIVDASGSIIPFEINCRISGTNSIRANFGFKDVQYTLEEFLLKRAPTKPNIKKGVATRVLMDVIYEDVTDFDAAKDGSAKHHIY